jgi:RNA polymerase sigma factor (sigma-70 family)
MKEHPEDKQIISEILRGGPQAERAFEHLVLKYGRSLYHQIFTVLRNDAQSKDVLQNVFIKVWTGLSSFREESGLYTWLYRITRNETLNHVVVGWPRYSHSTWTFRTGGKRPGRDHRSPQ